MFPLKPPVPKKFIEDIKLVNFPIFNENGTILEENEWPSLQAIFNGKHIIVKNSNDISHLSKCVSHIIIVSLNFFLGSCTYLFLFFQH